MSPGEIKRFADKFGLAAIMDRDGKAYVDAGLKYYKLADSEILAKIEREPRLLLLPLVRSGKLLSIGADEVAWKAMMTASPTPTA